MSEELQVKEEGEKQFGKLCNFSKGFCKGWVLSSTNLEVASSGSKLIKMKSFDTMPNVSKGLTYPSQYAL